MSVPRNAPMYTTMLGWAPQLPMRMGSMLEQQKGRGKKAMRWERSTAVERVRRGRKRAVSSAG